MLAVLLENDQHSRGVLTSMLRTLGFTSVHATARLEEFIYLLEHEAEPIDLIISSQNLKMERDFSLSELATKHPHLERCPVISISEYWLDKSYSPFKRPQSRVDSILSKPLRAKTLQNGVAEAFEHRASLRSTLVFYGSERAASLLEEEILTDKEIQWKRVAAFQEPKKFAQFLKENPLMVGGILIEPNGSEASLASEIQSFQRSKKGYGTPLCIYGQDPKILEPFLKFVDLSFSEGTSWERVLSLLSKRSLFGWKMRYQIHEIRAAIKKNELKRARALIAEGKRWDEDRWELLELSGSIFDDNEELWKALETQPCSPFAYLALLKNAPEEERKKILEKSRLFCPRHPRLMEIRS